MALPFSTDTNSTKPKETLFYDFPLRFILYLRFSFLLAHRFTIPKIQSLIDLIHQITIFAHLLHRCKSFEMMECQSLCVYAVSAFICVDFKKAVFSICAFHPRNLAGVYFSGAAHTRNCLFYFDVIKSCMIGVCVCLCVIFVAFVIVPVQDMVICNQGSVKERN